MKNIVFFLLIFSSIIVAQQKYFIYFKDKGPQSASLSKGTPAYNSALELLSEKSIQRREKTMGNEIIIFEDIPVYQSYIDNLKSLGIEPVNILKWPNAVSAFLNETEIKKINTFSFVKDIQPVRVFRSRNFQINTTFQKGPFDSSFYGNSYTQANLSDIPQVHKKGITGNGVLMGVLDTGFKWKTHEATRNARVLGEYDFIFRDSVTENQGVDVPSQHDHGTVVFSVIAGFRESELVGTAHDAEFLLAKTEDVRSETRVEEDNYAAALEWMESLGVDITTSSLGYSDFDNYTYTYQDMDGRTAVVTKAAETAFKLGVLVITSAGNEGNKEWFYITAPADGINTIAVGAVDFRKNTAGFSSRGPSYDGRIKPDITAMGVSVIGASAYFENQYTTATGTSLAAPVAAGAAALILSAHNYLNNVQLRDIIIKTAGNYKNPDNISGYGIISAQKAVEFPNLKKISSSAWQINKVFVEEGISNVKLFVSADGRTFNEALLSTDSIRHAYTLPALNNNQIVRFYFTYDNSSAGEIKLPESGYYSFRYGDLLIKESTLPDDYDLSYNYPNPFNSATRINFYVKSESQVVLVIYDAMGQKVKTVYNSFSTPGEYSVEWDGRSDNDIQCSSGIYIYRLTANGQDYSQKMVLLR